MPLDDHEQQILAEIERQFYEEDPDLAHAVRNIDRSGRFGVRLPAVGAVVGVTIIILSFTVSTLAAIVGFLVLVVSITALAHGVQARSGPAQPVPPPVVEARPRIFRRFRRS
jgi:hypothetical protein